MLSPVHGRGWSSSHNCQWSRLPTKMLLTGRGIPGRGVGCRLGDAGMSPWFRHTHECCVLNNARMRCRVFIKTCHHGAGHHQHNANTCLGLARHNVAHTTLRSSTAPWIFITTLHSTTLWTHNTGSWFSPVSRVMGPAGARQHGQVAAATQQINRYLLSKGDLVWIRVWTVFAWTIIRQVMFW